MAKSQTKKKTTHERERDPWFNPYRYPASERARIAVGEALYSFEKRENRKRARKIKDRQWLWQLGHALLPDLAYHYLNGSPGNGLVVARANSQLRKHSRYYPPFFTRSFPKLLNNLESAGYLKQKKGVFSGLKGKSTRTTIRAGTKLVEVIKKHQITFDDLGVSAAEEVIILKRAKRDYWDQGGQIEYKDTPTTERLRAEVRELTRGSKTRISRLSHSHTSVRWMCEREGCFGILQRQISKAAEGSLEAFGKPCPSAHGYSALLLKARASLNSTTPN